MKKRKSNELENIFKDIYKNIKREIPAAKKGLILFYKSLAKIFSKKKGKSKQKQNKGKIISLIILDLLISIWVFLSLFLSFFVLYLSGVVITISGFAIIIASIFGLIFSTSVNLNSLFFSSLFSGAGVIFLGILISTIFSSIMKGFLKITNKYFKLHSKVFGGKK